MSLTEWGQHNNLRLGVGKENRQSVVNETLPTAFYYVYEHLDALRSWDRLVQDPEYRTRERYGGKAAILTVFASHHNGAYRYMGDCVTGGIETLPQNDRYNILLRETDSGYDRLHRRALRYVFAGEDSLTTDDPGRLITSDEVNNWMIAHSAKPEGYIEGVVLEGVQDTSGIIAFHNSLDLVRYFRINRINDKSDTWSNRVEELFFGRFAKDMLQLAVQKLACGMVVIDQVVHEAANLDRSVSSDYRPHEFQPDTGERLPTLEQLWKQSHHLVETLTDPKDVLLMGLFRNALSS